MRSSRVLFLSSLTVLCSLNAVSQTRPSPAPLSTRASAEWSSSSQSFSLDALPNKGGSALLGATQGPSAIVSPDPAQTSQTCFTMRSYLFRRDPASDVTRPAGSSTCQNAAKFRMKDAAAVPASVQR